MRWLQASSPFSLLCLLLVAFSSNAVNLQGELSMEWSEFSFILKPSPLGGVGVFAIHDILAGTHLFTSKFETRTMKIKDIPPPLLRYCIYTSDEECLCPGRFDRMEIGWYI